METNFEIARIAIPAPEHAPPRAQHRAREDRAAVLGRARFISCVRGRAYCGADRLTNVLENIAWLALAICSGLVLFLSL